MADAKQEPERAHEPTKFWPYALGLFVLAFVIRLLPTANAVFGGPRTTFFGNDAYYHFRRIAHALEHYPHIIGFDPYLNFPEGAKSIWPPLFDFAFATLLLPAHALGGLDLAERVAACLPPVIGGLSVVAAAWLARRLFDLRVAVVSGLCLSVLSAHYWYSQAGFIDHHCAVSLVATLLFASGAQRLSSTSPPGGSSARAACLAGALCAAALLLWPGALLYVALLQLALFVDAATRPTGGEAARAARELALLNAVAFVGVAPSGLTASWAQWGAMSPTVLTQFQPWAFGVLASCAFGCALLFERQRNPGPRLAIGIGLGIALVALSAAALPALREGAADAWQWISRDEAFQASVAESKPLFEQAGKASTRIATRRLSYFVFLFPLALVWLVRARNEDGKARALLFLAFAASLLAVFTVGQKRFFNELSPLFAIVMGWSVVRVSDALAARGAPRRVAMGIASLLCLGLLWPSLGEFRFGLASQWASLQGEAGPLRRDFNAKRVLVHAGNWLRDYSEDPGGFGADDPEVQPTYGVLCDWDRGHVLLYAARRPMVVGNFGDDLGGENFAKLRTYQHAREAEALELARSLKVRFVVSRPLALGPPAPRDAAIMRRALAANPLAALARHRLVYQSNAERRGEAEVRIYEIVAGARMHGRARPGAHVRASLSLQPRGQLPLAVEYETVAGPDGSYELRVPYATRRSGGLAVGRYRISAGGPAVEFAVSDAAVLGGDRVAVPAL